MGSSGGGGGGFSPQGGVPIAGRETPFGGGLGRGDVGSMRQQLAALLGGRGGMPWPGNPAPPQVSPQGPMLARPPPSGGATPAQLAMPTGAAGHGPGWMGYSGTGTGDWNYATQTPGGNTPGTYNYAGFNVSHGIGDALNKGQVSAASMPGQAGYLAKPVGAQGGFLPKPR